MRLRTLRVWHKYQKIWLSLLGWALLSLMMLLLGVWSISDYDGGFGRIKPLSTAEIKGEDIRSLNIAASGIKVEIAGSSDSKKIKAYFYGDGYAGETVQLYREGHTAHIALSAAPVVSGDYGYHRGYGVTLRIIVPKKAYEQVTITMGQADAVVRNMRSDSLILEIQRGTLQLEEMDLKQATVTGADANITMSDCHINDLTLNNDRGNTLIERSGLRHLHYQGGSGDALIRQRTVKGIWSLAGDSGDITVLTTQTPYNLLCDLSSRRGSIQINYKKFDWDKLIEDRLTDDQFQGIVGEGSHMLLIDNEKGNIYVGKNE